MGFAHRVACVVFASIVLPAAVWAKDLSDVKAAELDFNAAQNAGNIQGMARYCLPVTSPRLE